MRNPETGAGRWRFCRSAGRRSGRSLAASSQSVSNGPQYRAESTYAKYTIQSHILHCAVPVLFDYAEPNRHSLVLPSTALFLASDDSSYLNAVELMSHWWPVGSPSSSDSSKLGFDRLSVRSDGS